MCRRKADEVFEGSVMLRGSEQLGRSLLRNALQSTLVLAGLAAVFGQRTALPLEWLRTHPSTAERIRRLLALEPDVDPLMH
ncbi:MAG: hypothetical protein EA417_06560 [Gammaproteobacteria bacterium]|nr:MAG: hypothetical protein EA417_06560 [Gammaproteobacteria bacterium]